MIDLIIISIQNKPCKKLKDKPQRLGEDICNSLNRHNQNMKSTNINLKRQPNWEGVGRENSPFKKQKPQQFTTQHLKTCSIS